MGILRIWLAFSVINAHTNAFSSGFLSGSQAVQVFFLLSGFLISFIQKYNSKYLNYRVFIANRFARIYSGYWVCIIVVVLLSFDTYFKNFKEANFSIPLIILLLSSNLFIFGADFTLFLSQSGNALGIIFNSNFLTDSQPLYRFLISPPSWSLPLELIFYCIAPLMLRRKILLLVGIVSLVIRIALLIHFGVRDPWDYRFFPSELLFFLCGILSYYIYEKIKASKHLKNRAFLLTMVFCIYALLSHQRFKAMVNSILGPAVGQEALLMLIISFSIFAVPILFHYFRDSSIDRLIGEYSYPVYLLHHGVIIFLTQNQINHNLYVVSGITCAVTYVLTRPLRRSEKYLRSCFEKLFTLGNGNYGKFGRND